MMLPDVVAVTVVGSCRKEEGGNPRKNKHRRVDSMQTPHRRVVSCEHIGQSQYEWSTVGIEGLGIPGVGINVYKEANEIWKNPLKASGYR